MIINEIPYGTSTSGLIDNILKANEKGKIKIKKIEDNTAASVEIIIHLPNGISPDKTIDALYAFTDCESSISPLGCVIIDNKPHFIGVSEMLTLSTDHTASLLKKSWKYSWMNWKTSGTMPLWSVFSLKIEFIGISKRENTWEGVLEAIRKGLEPHISILKRAVVEEDLVKLTEIRIKRISKFDIDKAQQKIEVLEGDIAEVKNHLAHLVDYAINYFKHLIKTYGKERERKSEIRIFDDVDAKKVVVRNQKLYLNRAEGFIGTSLRKDEYLCDCSDIDDVIVFTKEGKMQVVRVDSKIFVSKDIIHAAIFKKNDTRTIYNMIYKDGKKGSSFIKRFAVKGITRDKVYEMTQGTRAPPFCILLPIPMVRPKW